MRRRVGERAHARDEVPSALSELARRRKRERRIGVLELRRVLDAGDQPFAVLARRVLPVPIHFRRERRIVAVGRLGLLLLELRLTAHFRPRQQRRLRELVSLGVGGGCTQIGADFLSSRSRLFPAPCDVPSLPGEDVGGGGRRRGAVRRARRPRRTARAASHRARSLAARSGRPGQLQTHDKRPTMAVRFRGRQSAGVYIEAFCAPSLVEPVPQVAVRAPRGSCVGD